MPRLFLRKPVSGGALTVVAALLLTFCIGIGPRPAHALSELRPVRGEQQAADETPENEEQPVEDPLQIPLPDPLIQQGGQANDDPNADTPDVSEPEPPVEVIYDISKAPPAVARMRELIIEAATTGDIERLRPLLGKGPTQTQVTIVETEGDPVSILKGASGDPEGAEILAILLDVLAAGFVHTDAGTPQEMYVWPYFTEKSLNALTPPETVELLRIVTAGDLADMQEFGGYNFHRVGITPDGQWSFFVSGD